MYQVPVVSMMGMVFTLLVSIGLPIVLCVLAAKRLHAKLSAFVIGAAVFIIFVMMAESLFHSFVLGATGDVITGNIWLYGLYGGLAAGVFEETGRFLAMKFYMKRTLRKENAVMYGIGHGGIESIMLIGINYFSNLMVSVIINTGQLEPMLAGLDDTTREATVSQLSALWTLPSYTFWVSGMERISAILLQIVLSYMVYRAVKEHRMKYYGLAILLHFVVDALLVILSGILGEGLWQLLLLEFVLLAVVVLLAAHMWKQYRTEAGEGENNAGVL